MRQALNSLSVKDGYGSYSGSGSWAVLNDPAIARMGGVEFPCFEGVKKIASCHYLMNTGIKVVSL